MDEAVKHEETIVVRELVDVMKQSFMSAHAEAEKSQIREIILSIQSIVQQQAEIVSQQQEIQNKIGEVHQAMYNPDHSVGLFARMREVERTASDATRDVEGMMDPKTGLAIEVDRLMQWKAGVNKLLWLFGGSTLALVLNALATKLM